MDQPLPKSMKILVWIVSLEICLFVFLGLWRPDGWIEFRHTHIHLQPLLTRLIVLSFGAVGFFLTWMLAKGRLWACYLFLVLFSIDLITQVTQRDIMIGNLNLVLDIIAILILISAIYNRHLRNRAARAQERGREDTI